MEVVTLTRKERIMQEREKNTADRKRRIQKYAVVGTVATGVMLSFNLEKALGCNSEYTVQKGDTLYSLANKYNVSIEQIQGANGLSSETIMVGQQLEVPTLVETHTEHEQQIHAKNVESSTYIVQRGDTLYSLAKEYGVTIEQLQKGNGLTTENIKDGQSLDIPSTMVNNNVQTKEIQGKKGSFATYTVAPGETLWSIARKFNMSVADLKLYNNMSSDMVLIDQKLVIQSNNLTRATGTIVGAADHVSVEIMINGEPIVLQVAYGTAERFGNLSGEKVELVYHNSNRPELVSFQEA